MEIKASIRYLGVAPRKVRLAGALVKGMDLASAEYQLMHRVKRSAPVLLKLLRSAAASAKHNFHIEDRNLRVKDLRVDAGPTTSRYRARAFGRAATIRRRTSHVSLVLETMGDAPRSGTRHRTAPALRTATAEDMRGGASNSRSTAQANQRQKKKSSGFMPRIFQRKVV